MKSKKWIGIALFVIGILLVLYFVVWRDQKPQLTEKVTAPIGSPNEITKVVEESLLIDDFIMSRIPGGEEDFFKREHFTSHAHAHDEDITGEELKEVTMQYVYSAFMLQDVDQLTVAFSPDSIRTIQEDTDTLIDLSQELGDFLSLVNRNGQLEKLEYQFELDEYDIESNKGVLTLLYSDGLQIPVDIEIQVVGDENHRAFEVITPLLEIKKLFV